MTEFISNELQKLIEVSRIEGEKTKQKETTRLSKSEFHKINLSNWSNQTRNETIQIQAHLQVRINRGISNL